MYLFFITYIEAKKKAIVDLNSRQLILAENAKAEIEYFFLSITNFLSELSSSSHIIEFDETGKIEMDFALGIRPEGINAITRVDETAKIIYTTPFNADAIGRNIYDQKHIQKIFNTHEPVAGEVFEAVQGYRAVAVHVPVFKGSEFRGSLAVLIDFPSISKRYLQNIHIGETGYAWMTSREGIELYCPITEHIGESVFDTYKDFPSLFSMIEKMLQGEQGEATYEYSEDGKQHPETIKKHAVFLPIKVVDSFWCIVVASAEKEVLASLVNLKNKLMLIIGLLLVFSVIFSYYSIKAWAILRDEENRKKVEKQIRNLSRFRKLIIDNANVWLNVLDEKGNVVVWNKAAESISGYTKEEVIGHGKVWAWLYPDAGYREEIFSTALAIIEKYEVVNDFETRINRKDGQERIIAWHSRNFEDDSGVVIGSIALGRDITEQKLAEEALRESSRKYKQLLEDIGPSITVFSHRLDGTFTYISPSVKELTGFDHEDLLGKQWQGVMNWLPESLRLATDEIQKLVDGQKNSDFEMSFFNNDSIRTLHIQSHLIEDKKGNLHIEGTMMEITQRKQTELEREKLIEDLQSAIKDIKTLSGLLPICSNCKKIRDDQGYWNSLESFLEKHSDISFSHSLCKDCADKLYGKEEWYVDKE